MDNKTITRSLKLYAQLLELHEENPFKIKSISNAQFKLSKYAEPLSEKSLEDLAKIEGVGKSVAAKIMELVDTAMIAELEELKKITPERLIDMLAIKGLGPKKVRIIWKELEIESVGELYYACNENRLVTAKGFGLKTQDEVKRLIEFTWGNAGKQLYANAELLANEMLQLLHKAFPSNLIQFTGQLRRKCEIVENIALIMQTDAVDSVQDFLNNIALFQEQSKTNELWTGVSANQVNLAIHFTSAENFALELFLSTGSESHFGCLPNFDAAILKNKSFTSEEEIYQYFGLPYIAPELREGLHEVEKASKKQLPVLIELADLKGSLHNHSTWSDGIHSLKEMANHCETLGYQYLGICDHSRSAFYANGLSIERVLAQHQEIDDLNHKNPNFRILKGIESDILNDGALDYPEEILKQFDFIVASIHSNLKMDQEKATNRLIKAIENPYTSILGHPTSRLLLARAGYPIDHQKVIDACASNQVVIEINANPLRLDLDWRWIEYALSKGVLLSINPDAHRKEGLMDMYFGICVARKGGLSKEMCLNTLTAAEIVAHFQNRKSNIA